MRRCRRIHPWIVRSLDGDLEPREALRLARHLSTCTSCRIVLARETRLAAMIADANDTLIADASFSALALGIASRVLPALRFDVATPGWPRFAADETNGWIGLLGSAAQWVRMTVLSIGWAELPASLGPWTIGAFALGVAVSLAVTLVAVSGALAWAARTDSRAS